MAERISGITFKRCDNPRFSVSHSERTELSQPSYLLPPEKRLPNVVLYGLGKEDEIASIYERRMANLSRQAKAAKATPFLEGVFVLPEYDGSPDYKERTGKFCLEFIAAFEEETGCKVLHSAMHFDEGYVDAQGKAHLNTHAHILVDKTNSDGKMWKPGPKGLAKIQTLLAEKLHMKRGKTIYERNGAPSRKHIPHGIYREIKESERELLNDALNEASEINQKKIEGALEFKEIIFKNKTDSIIKRVQLSSELEIRKLKTEVENNELKYAYGVIRAFLKGTGLAKQNDYQLLKKKYEDKRPVIISWAKHIEDNEKVDAEMLLWLLRGHEKSLLLERRTPSAGCLSGGSTDLEEVPDFDEIKNIVAPMQRWHREDVDLYLLPEKNAEGRRLAFEDKGLVIDVKLDGDRAAIAAALHLAELKWSSGVVVEGTPEFMQLVREVAQEENLGRLLADPDGEADLTPPGRW